jgi:hypothetical protein
LDATTQTYGIYLDTYRKAFRYHQNNFVNSDKIAALTALAVIVERPFCSLTGQANTIWSDRSNELFAIFMICTIQKIKSIEKETNKLLIDALRHGVDDTSLTQIKDWVILVARLVREIAGVPENKELNDLPVNNKII